MSARRPRFQGFTLVELLVVVGIITLLIAILLPSLSTARQQATKVQCLAHLRQLGQAMEMYLLTNRNAYPQPLQDAHLPDSTGSTTSLAARTIQGQVLWFNALDPYLRRQFKAYDADDPAARDYARVKQDPVYASFDEDIDTTGGPSSKTFKMNAHFGQPSTGVRWTKTAAVRRPAVTVLIFDGAAPDIGVRNDINPGVYFHGTEIDVALRHARRQSANVLFADGHAQEIRQATHQRTTTTFSIRVWHREFASTSDPFRDARQELVWNFRR